MVTSRGSVTRVLIELLPKWHCIIGFPLLLVMLLKDATQKMKNDFSGVRITPHSSKKRTCFNSTTPPTKIDIQHKIQGNIYIVNEIQIALN